MPDVFKNVFAAVFSPFLKSTVEQIDDVDDSPDGGSGSLINAGPASVLEDGGGCSRKPKVISFKADCTPKSYCNAAAYFCALQFRRLT